MFHIIFKLKEFLQLEALLPFIFGNLTATTTAR